MSINLRNIKNVTHRLTSWSLIAALTLQPVLAQAQSIVVQGADNGVRPRVDTSLSGHPVLNISTPNGAGVSHDIYTAFTAGDLIVNNSATNTNTQIGGFIEGNPSLTPGGEASTWIGEVVGGNQTQLSGILEVAGPSLDLVLANEFGITCDGCGFYNTTRTTLTTGIPVYGSDGSLKGFDVKRGLVRIGASGLNPQDRLALGDTSRVDVIARAAQLYGQMRAKEANIIAGANVVDYNWSYDPSTGLASGITPQAGTGAVPALAVDVSALGGMYAGAIKLIATEAGVGVRLNGEMASSSNIALSSSGRLSLGAPSGGRTPTVKAKRQVRVRAAGPILLEGAMTSEEGDFVQILSMDSGLTITGEISGGAVTLQSAGLAAINGAVSARSALKIASEREAVVIGAAADLLSGSLEVEAATDITVSGIVGTSGDAVLAAADAVEVDSTGELGAGSTQLSGTSAAIAGLVSASTDLNLSAGAGGTDISGLALADAFALSSAGDVHISGAVAGVSALEMSTTGALTSTAGSELFGASVDLRGKGLSLSGLLSAQSDLTLAAGSDGLTSAADVTAGTLALSSAGDAQLGGVTEIAGAATLDVAGAFGTDAGSGFYASAVTASSESAALAGEMIADGALQLSLTRDAAISGRVIAETSRVDVGGETRLSGVLAGTQSLSLAGSGALTIETTGTAFAPDLNLMAAQVTHSGRVSGDRVVLAVGGGGLSASGAITGSFTDLRSAGDLTLSGDVTGTSELQVAASGLLSSTDQSRLYGGTLELSGARISLAGLVTSQSDALITSTSGALEISADVQAQSAALDAARELTLTGIVQTSGQVTAQAGETLSVAAGAGIKASRLNASGRALSNAGVIVTDTDMQLTATSGGVSNSGQVVAGGDLLLTAPLGLENTGLVQATRFDLTSPVALSFGASSQIVADDLDITAPTLSNAGLLAGQTDLDVQTLSGLLSNSGTILGADVSLISAAGLDQNGTLESSGAITARTDNTLSFGAGSSTLGRTITLQGKGLSLSGLLSAQGDLTLAAGSDGLTSAADVTAGTLALSSAEDAQLGGVAEITGAATLDIAGAFGTDAGSGFYASAVTATSESAALAGEMIAEGAVSVTTRDAAAISGIVLGKSTGLTAGADATISGFLAGQDQLILTSGGVSTVTDAGILYGADLDARAARFTNAGAVLGTSVDLVTTSGALAQGGALIGDAVRLVSATDIEHSGQSVGQLSFDASAASALVASAASEIAGGEITLTAGSLEMAGLATAEGALALTSTSGDITNDAGLRGAGVTLASAAQMTHSGIVNAETEARLTATGEVTTTAGSGIAGTDIFVAGESISNAGVLVSEAATTLTARTGAVSNSGTVSAGSALTLSSPAALENSGLLLAGSLAMNTANDLSFGSSSQIVADDLSITATSLSNAGLISGKDNLDLITTSGDLSNSGDIAGSDVVLSSAAAFDNSGRIHSSGALGVTALGALGSDAGAELIGQVVTLTGRDITNAGLINGVSATLTASDALTHTGMIYLSGVAQLTAASAQIDGSLRAHDARIEAAQITTGSASVLETDRDLLLIAGTDFTHNGRAAALGTLDARVTAGGSMVNGMLHGQQTKLASSAALTLGSAAQIIGQSEIDISASALTGGLDASDFSRFFTNGNLKLAFASGGLSVGGAEQIAHSGNLALSLGGSITNAGTIKSSGHLELWSGGNLLNNEGKILAGGDMVLSAQSGTITNRSGSIEAGGSMLASAANLTNEYRSLTITDADSSEVEVIVPEHSVPLCIEWGGGPDSGVCYTWGTTTVPEKRVTLTDVSLADLPPETCFEQTETDFNTVIAGGCSDLARQIGDEAQGTGWINWGSGSTVIVEGARPDILSGGSIVVSAGLIANNAGLISATDNVSLSATAALSNAAYVDTFAGGQARYSAWGYQISPEAGLIDNFYFDVSNVTSTSSSGNSYAGEVLAGGNLTTLGSAGPQDGTLAAGSSATVAPRHSTSVTATAMPTLALGTSTPSASSITAPPSGSIAALAAEVASRASVSAPSAKPSLSAQGASGAGGALPVASAGLDAATFGGTGTGSAPATDPSLSAGTSTATIVLPVIARPGSFNTDSVNELIDQGTTRLGSARRSQITQAQFMTSNYMMDVDRLQYRDELLFNRQDGLPFQPGRFGQSDEALLQQSYEAAIAGEPGVAFRAAGPTLLGGAGFGLTQDGSMRLAALSQERGAGALTVTGRNITSAGGRFTATGGITITADQSALFTGATIDGAGVTLRANEGDLSLAGSQVTAVDDLSLQAGGSIDVYALSESFESFSGPSDNRTRTYGTRLTRSTLTSGGDFSAIAGEDIKIAAAKVDAGGDATLSATGDVVLAFASETNGSERQGRRSSEERFNSTSVVTELTTGGAFGITGRNVTALGTRMAAGTSARIDARETLIFGVAEDVSTRSNTRSSSSFFGLNKSRTEESVATGTAIAAQITSGTSIDLIAGGNAGLIGTDIDAGRNLGLDVGGTLSIAAARDTRLESSSRSEKGLFKGGGNGFLSLFGSETTRQSALQSTVSSAELSAGADLTIRTGGDMNVSGSILEAASAATLDVGGTLAVAAAADTFESSAQEQKKGFGLSLSASGGGFSLFAGARRTRSETGRSGNSIVPSQLVAGTDLTITAGRDVVQAGSRFASGSTRGAEELLSATDEGGSILVTAGGDILSSAGISEIALNSFDEEVRVGITLSVSSSTLSAMQQIGQSVGTATSGYGGLEGIGLASGIMQGTQGLKTITGNLNNTYGEGAVGPDLYREFTNPVTGLRQNTPSGLNRTTASALGLSANVSIGISRSQNRSDQSNATASVSSMEAQGGSVTLKAGRDVGLQGTEVTATKDILLDAGRDLSIVSAQSLYQTDASSRSQSASLGMDIFSGTPTASASANRSNSTVSGAAQSNASLSANGSVSLQSGRDTVIAGARVEGDSLSAKVGRDLTLASRQDTETTTGGSDGVSVSLTGGSVSKGSTEASKAWVTEQTGLAADGALRIEVEGHTQIDGAVIASRSDDLALETGTLGFSDITDKERSSAVNATLGLRAGGVNVQGQVAHVDREQINRATIGAGQIAITDPEAQARLTQTDATAGRSFDIAKLNRDVDRAQEITKDERSGAQFYVDTEAIEEIVKGFPTVKEALNTIQKEFAEIGLAQLGAAIANSDDREADLKQALKDLADCHDKTQNDWFSIFVRPAYAASCVIEVAGKDYVIHDKRSCGRALARSVFRLALSGRNQNEVMFGLVQGTGEELEATGEAAAELWAILNDPQQAEELFNSLGDFVWDIYESGGENLADLGKDIMRDVTDQAMVALTALANEDYVAFGNHLSGLAIDVAIKIFAAPAAAAKLGLEGAQGLAKIGKAGKNTDFWKNQRGSAPTGKAPNGAPTGGFGPMRRSVDDPNLDAILDSNYGNVSINGARVGNGGTADALRYENATGELLSPSGHRQKAIELRTRLQTYVRRATNSPNPNSAGTTFTQRDIDYANELIRDLDNAIGN